MMKKVIKIMSLSLSIFVLLLSLTGCGEVQKAEKTVSGMFDAFKILDFETAKTYVDLDELDLSDDKESLTGNAEMFMKNLFDKLNYKIISSKKIDNQTVMVKTEITAIDMKPVMGEFFTNAMQFAFSNAFTPEEQQLSDEEMDKKMEELFIQSVSKSDLATVTNTVDIKVVEVEKTWKAAVDETFTDALFGGLMTVAEDMEKSFNQNSN
jgi:hypothetical protein